MRMIGDENNCSSACLQQSLFAAELVCGRAYLQQSLLAAKLACSLQQSLLAAALACLSRRLQPLHFSKPHSKDLLLAAAAAAAAAHSTSIQ